MVEDDNSEENADEANEPADEGVVKGKPIVGRPIQGRPVRDVSQATGLPVKGPAGHEVQVGKPVTPVEDARDDGAEDVPGPAVSGDAPHAGDKTKEVPRSTKQLGESDRADAMRAQLDARVTPAGVIKTTDWEAELGIKSEGHKDMASAPSTEVVQVEQVEDEEADQEAAPADAWAPPEDEEPLPEEQDLGSKASKRKAKKAKKKKDAKEQADTEAAEKEEDDPFYEEPIFPLTDDDEQLDYYPVKPPHAFVQVVFNQTDKETRYRVIEPELTRDERKILHFIEDTMVDILDAAPEDIETGELKPFLNVKFDEIVEDYAIDLGDEEDEPDPEDETGGVKGKLLYYIYRDFIGEGRIDVMMSDPLIEDVSCDGPHQPVFLYHRKHESVKSNVKFRDHDELDSFVIRMAQRSGKHVSIAEPILDATMPDGSRLQATLAKEVSAYGSTFTIRKFKPEPFTPPDLVRFGTMSAEILAYWWLAMQNGASAIYAGGTASGKTTGLNAILLFIPPQMKIVSIEDTREINIPHPNWIAGITRGGFGPRDEKGRQAGEIDMFQLLKNALRQRPEYIIVGEVRGAEAYNLFQAMATGHAAYGTMHADSVDAVIHRLESDPINIPRSLLSALDVISIQIQTRVGGKRVRRTKQLSEIVGLDPHTQEILTNEVFRWVPKDDSFKYSGVSYVLERIQVERGMTPDQMRKDLENRVEIIKYLIRHDLRDFRDVGGIVSTYYKDPDEVMRVVRADEKWAKERKV